MRSWISCVNTRRVKRSPGRTRRTRDGFPYGACTRTTRPRAPSGRSRRASRSGHREGARGRLPERARPEPPPGVAVRIEPVPGLPDRLPLLLRARRPPGPATVGRVCGGETEHALRPRTGTETRGPRRRGDRHGDGRVPGARGPVPGDAILPRDPPPARLARVDPDEVQSRPPRPRPARRVLPRRRRGDDHDP